MTAKKQPLLVAPHLDGREYTKAHANAADEWFGELFRTAVPDAENVALLAVGGYGRGVLWPYSDLDVVLVHHKRKDIGELAERLWYPVWDRGLKLGYTVVTVDEAFDLAESELETATSYLDSRLVAGDAGLHRRFRDRSEKLWHKKSEQFLLRLSKSIDERHRTAGDVAFTIEPDLKMGRGGLRDLQGMRWAERAQRGFATDLLDDLQDDSTLLLSVRLELHRLAGRAGDVLSLDDQPDVAAVLGYDDDAVLMKELAEAGRRVGWHSDEAWDRWHRDHSRPRRGRPVVMLDEHLQVREEHIELNPDVDVAADPLLLLRVADLAANRDMTIGRATLSALAEHGSPIPEPWPEEARRLFAGIFLAGAPAIDVVEDLDHFGLMVRLLPEWGAVRCKPQRNVMHTFTVDRHLCQAAANAAALIDRVVRPDLLVIGALLHDIGKGYSGDHTEVGMDVIRSIGERMGYPAEEVAVLVDLCRLHLLLPDVATRRDLSDSGTIRAVAAAVDSVEFLHLLAALTEADSMATGPSAWGSWKAGLLAALVERTDRFLRGDGADESAPDFPPPETLARMRLGVRDVVTRGATLSVVSPDEPLLFSRVAGVVAVNGLDVLDAAAYSDDDGMAAAEFIVQTSTGAPVEWDKAVQMVHTALDGRLALSARIAQRGRAYAIYQRRLSANPPRRLVNVDNEISDTSTVIDVHAPDTVGLLYRVTQAFGEFGLDIRSAKVQTMGPEAVDSFYICDRRGQKITDRAMLDELELALREAMGEEA
ncbi:MAG: [protein-PII] uridylyltransferase [Acidimicrobiales bacterium]|jgi:[protein-PII] uridylyltransferase